MKEYLQLFRGSAFNGSITLLRRILLPNLVITILLTLVSLAAIFPLILKGFGWGISDLMNFGERMKEVFSNMSQGQQPMEIMGQLFTTINFGYLALAFIVALLLGAYRYCVFFKLNDNEVRGSNNKIGDAIKGGFSEKVLSMIGLYFILMILMVVVLLIYGLFVGLLMAASKILGVLIAFILFFVVAILIIRFLIAPAALMHGNMGVFDALGYSFKNITWKRAGILLLMSLVFIIAFFIVSMIIGAITGAFLGHAEMNMTYLIISQIISAIINAILAAFLFTSFTAIYFRYSDDSDGEETNIEEHLINEN